MKKLFKSIFNFETILSCYISAIGYGAGYNLPNSFHLHPIICLACCFGLGAVFDLLSKKILSTEFFNASKKNKWIVASIVYGSYLIAWVIVDYVIDYDLDYDVINNIGTVIVIQVVLLVIKMIKSNKETTNS